MRPRFSLAALITVCALFTALIAAGPAAARITPPPAARQPQPGGVLDPKPHPVLLLAKSYTAPILIVRSGDTLSQIARRACHRASFWPEVWWANRHKVHNPNLIRVGQRLRMPACRAARRAHVTAALDAIPAPPPAPVAAASADSPPPQAAATAAAPVAATYTGSSSMQACIISRESGGNPRAVNPASGAGGLYQFLPSTWAALGHSGLPQDASVAEQNAAYYQAVAASGYSDWAPYDGC